MKKSPIYLFYEIVLNGANGKPGDEEDVHYWCLHGGHKVCMIKRLMRSNLNGVCSYSYLSIYLTSLISFCELPACPCKPYVHLVFYPQRPCWTPNTWRSWDGIWKMTTGWEGQSGILSEAWYVIREHQEGVSKSISLCHCKCLLSGLSITYNFMTGAMGPRKIWAGNYGVGCCLWPTIWRGWKAQVHCDDELYTSHW